MSINAVEGFPLEDFSAEVRLHFQDEGRDMELTIHRLSETRSQRPRRSLAVAVASRISLRQRLSSRSVISQDSLMYALTQFAGFGEPSVVHEIDCPCIVQHLQNSRLYNILLNFHFRCPDYQKEAEPLEHRDFPKHSRSFLLTLFRLLFSFLYLISLFLYLPAITLTSSTKDVSIHLNRFVTAGLPSISFFTALPTNLSLQRLNLASAHA